jgi:hypothetical protein
MPSTRFDRLISELAKGQMMLMVGTGVSVYSTGNSLSASWKGLLTEGVDYCREWSNPKPSDEKVAEQREKLARRDSTICFQSQPMWKGRWADPPAACCASS